MSTSIVLSGLPLPPPCSQDQLHRSGLVGQPSLRIHLRIAGKRTSVLRDQDGEGGFTGYMIHWAEDNTVIDSSPFNAPCYYAINTYSIIRFIMLCLNTSIDLFNEQ